MRFLVEFIDAKYNVDFTTGGRNKREFAVFVATAGLEVDTIFTGDIVGDDKVAQTSSIRRIQGTRKTNIDVAIPRFMV